MGYYWFMAEIKYVDTKADLKKFINYPYQKYKDDPNWLAPLRIGEFEKFDTQKSPFFQHARINNYIAEENGKVVGRISVIDDDLHNQTHHDNMLFFGFFEARDNDIAQQLFNIVEDEAKKLGRGRIRGPVNPSLNDGAGFQLDAYDTDPYIMMPQSPPEYLEYVENAGYSKVKDLYAWRLSAETGLSEKLVRLADRVAKRYDFTVRSLNMKDYDKEVARVLDFYNSVWEDNWGQVKYTDEEAKFLAKELKMIVDPKMILFLEMKNELAGLAVGFPDINQVLRKMGNGRLLPFGIFHLLMRKFIIKKIRLPILGLKPEYRNKGLELVLINEFAKAGLKRGYKEAECSWILEDNDGINKGIKAAGAELYKTYRIFQKELVS